jgi:hypothetical protein
MNIVKVVLGAIAIFATACAFAESKIYGDWVLHTTDEGDAVVAMTGSDSGTTFGLVCRKDADGCYWSISSGNTCEDNSTSVYLINTDVGSASIETICQVANSGNNYVMLTPFDTITDVVRKSKSIGIAIPLDSGKFRVLRFSLTGSNQAMDAAYKVHEILRQNIGDEVL